MLYVLLDMTSENSFFRPYYDILPETLECMPVFWTEEELDYLKGSYLCMQINERLAAVEEDYEKICALAPDFADICSLDKFKWARCMVCSRNFGITCNGIKTAVLVPYADMLNHYRPRETKWQFEDVSQSFTITCLQSIAVGEQIYDSYGQKSNHRFLLNYGFSVENNVEPDGYCPNEVPITVNLSRDDALFETKFKQWWIKESHVQTRRIRLSMTDDERFKAVMSSLRIIVANANEFHSIVPLSLANASAGIHYHRNPNREAMYPLSTANELKSLYLFRSIVDDLISRYPTTYTEDLEMLNSKNVEIDPVTGQEQSVPSIQPFSNRRNALIQIAGEKEVLHFYLHFIEVGLKMLHLRSDMFPPTVLTMGNSSSNNNSISLAMAPRGESSGGGEMESVDSVAGVSGSSGKVEAEGNFLPSAAVAVTVAASAQDDIYIKLENMLKRVEKAETNPMVYNYCKNHVYHIRIQDERKQEYLKRTADYTKPTIV